MRNRIVLPLAALVLCMSALSMPLTAYAAIDATKPVCDAWLTGDTLRIEASDDSGVDAVYVDGQRINYLVNGAVEVKLKDYAGTGEKVCIYAVDFAGNQSATVEIRNPYYVQPSSSSSVAASAPPATPAPVVTTSRSTAASSSSTSQVTSTSTPAASSSASDTSETESAIPEDGDNNPLTPEGQATVMDNATEDEGKEFFTFATPEGNVFYLIVDRQRDDGNVYFLNAVTEQDLFALAESDGSTPGESAIPDTTATPEPTPTPDLEPEVEPEKEGGGIGTILLVVVAIAGVGGAGYYFKILKPKQQAALDDVDSEFDDDEYGEDMDFEGEDSYLPDEEYGDLDVDGDMEGSTDEEE